MFSKLSDLPYDDECHSKEFAVSLKKWPTQLHYARSFQIPLCQRLCCILPQTAHLYSSTVGHLFYRSIQFWLGTINRALFQFTSSMLLPTLSSLSY